MHPLVWLWLLPFATGWTGENRFAPQPVAVHGVGLLMPAFAYVLLQTTIVKSEGPTSLPATVMASDLKGKISMALYAAAIPLAFVNPWISMASFVAVAILWVVPDRRIEKNLPHA